MAKLLFSLLPLALSIDSLYAHAQVVYNIPSAVQSGPSNVQFVSTAQGLNSPKVTPINNTVFDYWYFDVASNDPADLSSIAINPFTTTSTGFAFVPPSDTVAVMQLTASFKNGSLFFVNIDATNASIIQNGNDAGGIWGGTGFSWLVTPDLSTYVMTINSPSNGVTGTVTFKRTAPAHYACGPVGAGVNAQAAPDLGWDNAIPDSVAHVNLVVGGTPLVFTGTGYQDKTWGNKPIVTIVKSWYQGHARVGPYSIVWTTGVGFDGVEHVTGYAALNGKILTASCAPGVIKVRPTGPGAVFPPVISTPNPTGYDITLNLGNREVLVVNVTVTASIVPFVSPEYVRSLGKTTGHVINSAGHRKKGITTYTGTALFEQFKISET